MFVIIVDTVELVENLGKRINTPLNRFFNKWSNCFEFVEKSVHIKFSKKMLKTLWEMWKTNRKTPVLCKQE